MWIEVARNSYLQDRIEILKNKYWETGADCLERAIGSSWWEWLVGSRCFFWRCPREFRSGIRDGHNQFQVEPWPRFLQTQQVERDKKVAEK